MPKELTVTYRAPQGDSKVVEMMGHTFYDGKPEKVTLEDDAAARLQANRYFECDPKAEPADPNVAPKHREAAGRSPARFQQDDKD
jgi:hypothetical protein